GLVFSRDLTHFPTPLNAPVATSPHILIVGGGVTRLVNAWILLDQGYRVTILSKEWASYGKAQRLTSQIAGALWEYPPAVCGQHTDSISLQHSKRWSMITYHIWDAIAACPGLAELSGVQVRVADAFFPVPIEEDPDQLSKMLEIMSGGVRGFRRDPGIIKERRVNPAYGAVDAYEHLAPVIDTDACMDFLKKLVTAKGANLITRTIIGDLFDQEGSLRAEYSVDVLVNSTGLSSAELAGDASCYPIRGGLIRVINDGINFPKVDHALSIAAGAVHDSNGICSTTRLSHLIVFIVPRNDNILLIGGIAEPHESKLSLTLDSPIIKRMRARCEEFLPGLKKARLDSEYPIAQGLRPFRQRNVRVERELRLHSQVENGTSSVSRIVHSYGQGGAGWSLSFDCAGDVLTLVEEALLDVPARPMTLEKAM
ncbi:hypothetical protein P280DRAFT_374754, partial [Massarina eburnea CBS 473.64]